MPSDMPEGRMAPQFQMSRADQRLLEGLPWQVPLAAWPEHGIQPLSIRRGDSRHPIIFVEREGKRYAIKETSPRMAEREIHNLRQIEQRGIPALSPVGSVIVAAPPIPLEVAGPGGLPHYMSGDRGYTVTKLAPRVVPHALLYRLPFTRRNKRRLWAAVALLLVELHVHGIYWGDPSLANVLIRIDGRRILAILADAETAEIFPGPVSGGLCEQDIELFGESLLWQAEDLRVARGIPEDEQVLGEEDFRYFEKRYRWLRREHARMEAAPPFNTLFQAERLLEKLNRWGFTLLGLSSHTLRGVVTVLPGWYLRRLQELLGITVPALYARRFYNMLVGHQAIMTQREGRELSVEEAAKDWYTRYHLPTILLLRQHLTVGQDPMWAYFSIMDHKWQLSVKAGREIPLDEAMLSWAMQQAEIGTLGEADPADLAAWWRGRESITQVMEPSLIEPSELAPLLSTGEQPLVKLPAPELEQKLTKILQLQEPESDSHSG